LTATRERKENLTRALKDTSEKATSALRSRSIRGSRIEYRESAAADAPDLKIHLNAEAAKDFFASRAFLDDRHCAARNLRVIEGKKGKEEKRKHVSR